MKLKHGISLIDVLLLVLHSEQRINDIIKMKDPVEVNEIKIYDKMSFFRGDVPVALFKIRSAKGGNYLCWICYSNAIEHSNYTVHSKNKSHNKVTKLYSHLKKKKETSGLN